MSTVRLEECVQLAREVQHECKRGWVSGGDLPKQFVNFLASLPIVFACGNSAGKIASYDHVTAGHCNHC